MTLIRTDWKLDPSAGYVHLSRYSGGLFLEVKHGGYPDIPGGGWDWSACAPDGRLKRGTHAALWDALEEAERAALRLRFE